MGMLAMALVLPKTSSAFWPFDKWFQKGEVMGEQTDSKKSSFSVRSLFVRTTPSVTPTPKEESKEVDEAVSETKIKQLAARKRITEAQRKVLMTRLAAIKAKRLEVKKLQESLVVWLKENKINQKDITETNTATETTTESGTQAVD